MASRTCLLGRPGVRPLRRPGIPLQLPGANPPGARRDGSFRSDLTTMCLGGRDHGRPRGVQDHAGKQAGTPSPDKRQQRHLSLGVDSRHQRLLVSASDTMTGPPDLLPGTLDLLILRTLQSTALHGWAISERIQDISEDVLQINQGSLYPCPASARASGMDRRRMGGV